MTRWAASDRLSADPKAKTRAYALAKRDIRFWVNNFVWTYDPRENENGGYLPFTLFPKQEEFLIWLEERVDLGEEFLVEKSRDAGASYIMSAYALHKWLFSPGFKSTFGANKAANVDNLNDPDSLFEKIRIMLERLPEWMKPLGWRPDKHSLYMRIVNPENGNVITGAAGDNIGRGGRSTLLVLDEAAHIERAERVEAATIASTEVRAWVSSPNGMGNPFARKRHGGFLPVFRLHWTDDPRKTKAWAAEKRAQLDGHIWAAEYEIDYAASVEGICIPGEWVRAAVMLSDMHNLTQTGGVGGLDVGGGKSENCFIARSGPIVFEPIAWLEADSHTTVGRAMEAAIKAGVRLVNYDSVGVGSGVTAALVGKNGVKFQPINVGQSPTLRRWPDGRNSQDMFANLKAEIWWLARQAFERSFERCRWEMGEDGGVKHPLQDCIILPDDPTLQTQLSLPKWFRNEKGRIIIESKEQLRHRGIHSPDRAEAFVLTLCDDLKPGKKVRSLPIG